MSTENLYNACRAMLADYDRALAYEELYETEKQMRKAAEASRDYWREEADRLSELVDMYAERSQEDPF